MSTNPTGTHLLPCSSILHVPILSIAIPLPLILIPLPSSHPAAISQPSCLHPLAFKPTPPSSLPCLSLISHLFPSLRPQLLYLCLHHPSFHLNPLSSPILSPLHPLPLSSLLPRGPHLHRLLFSTLIVFCLFVFPASLGQVGVVGQATEQGGHHRAGVHLLLGSEGSSVRTLEPRRGME